MLIRNIRLLVLICACSVSAYSAAQSIDRNEEVREAVERIYNNPTMGPADRLDALRRFTLEYVQKLDTEIQKVKLSSSLAASSTNDLQITVLTEEKDKLANLLRIAADKAIAAESNAARVNELEEALRKLTVEKYSAETSANQLPGLSSALETAKKDITTANSKLAEMLQQLTAAQAIAQKVPDIESALATANTTAAQVTNLTSSLAEEKRRTETLAADLTTAQKKLADLAEQLAKANTDHDKLRELIAALEKEQDNQKKEESDKLAEQLLAAQHTSETTANAKTEIDRLQELLSKAQTEKKAAEELAAAEIIKLTLAARTYNKKTTADAGTQVNVELLPSYGRARLNPKPLRNALSKQVVIDGGSTPQTIPKPDNTAARPNASTLVVTTAVTPARRANHVDPAANHARRTAAKLVKAPNTAARPNAGEATRSAPALPPANVAALKTSGQK